jgi:hypothetical protein
MLYILQNKEGRNIYGVNLTAAKGTSQFEEDLRKAFSMAIPSVAMRERRIKEGRGFGDLDGGGGVYKGKKINKKNNE